MAYDPARYAPIPSDVAAGRALSRGRKLRPRPPVGWARIDGQPARKCAAVWAHPSGWRIVHCGHPTANYPWTLYRPDGSVDCYGSGAPRTLAVAWAYIGDELAAANWRPEPEPARALTDLPLFAPRAP